MTTDPVAHQPQASAPQTYGLAIASLITGLTCLSPVAIILGHISLSKIKKSGGALTGGGLAIAGLVLGYVTLVIKLLIVIPVLFTAARAWNAGSDRAACMINQRDIEQLIRWYAEENGLEVGDALDLEKIKQDPSMQSMTTGPDGGDLVIELTCPKGGGLVISPTYLGPDVPHVTCPNEGHTIEYDFSY